MRQAHSLALEALSDQILKGIRAESMDLYAEYERMCAKHERVGLAGADDQSDLFTPVQGVPQLEG